MKTKPFLIIQLRPEDEASDGEFNAFLKCGKLNPDEVVRIRAERNGIPPIELKDYSAIIVGGSPFDITTSQDQKSSIQRIIERDFTELFDRVVPADFPFIGACSGNGLLGNYLGSIISRKYGEPVAGVDITLTPEGECDPLLKRLPKQFRALAGHKEACDYLPKKAVLLASSKTCPIQMFRVGQNVYATQFHPEADADVFVVRIHVYKNYGYFPPEDAGKLLNAVKNEKIIYPEKIIHRFIEKYRKVKN